MSARAFRYLLLLLTGICAGCANITTPTGGKRDKTPPRLVSISPADSLKNTRVKRIEMYFDEYITTGDVAKEVHISPIIAIDPTVTSLNKHVIVKIVDSLLDSNTTYRLSFGNAIRDLHEGNPFSNYTYTFSTGSYFDSLEIHGNVIDAATGLPDTGGVIVALYSARENDSAVVRHKPKYVTKVDGRGNFALRGLPPRSFRIYAIKDVNDNLIYDGPTAKEMIAFTGNIIYPGDTAGGPLKLRLFEETPDSIVQKRIDSAEAQKPKTGRRKETTTEEGLIYSVNLDTSNATRRTFDITHPINVIFNKRYILNDEKIRLSYDSAGVTIEQGIKVSTDPQNQNIVRISADWAQDKVYTLRLAKGFAKDTSGADVMPSRYTFRTFEDEDYGKITINLPAKYNDPKYVLMVTADNDTVYQNPVRSNPKILSRLRPAKYTFCIIVDSNGNGKWDTGDLFGKIQPEEVIPYNETLTLKAGWEHIIDFDKKPEKQNDKFNRR